MYIKQSRVNMLDIAARLEKGSAAVCGEWMTQVL